METISSSRILVHICKTTLHHNPEGHKAKTLPNLKQSSPYEARAHDTKQARHQDLMLGHAMGQV
jgi:hypothetical protein